MNDISYQIFKLKNQIQNNQQMLDILKNKEPICLFNAKKANYYKIKISDQMQKNLIDQLELEKQELHNELYRLQLKDLTP